VCIRTRLAGMRRRWLSSASSAHLGVLQLFKIELASKPANKKLRLLFPAGASTPSASAAVLAEAAAKGEPALISVAALQQLLGAEAPLKLTGAAGSVTLLEDNASTHHAPAAATAYALVPQQSEDALALALAHRSEPLAEVLAEAARLSEPDWSVTVARQAPPTPAPLTGWQRKVLAAASDGDASALAPLLRGCEEAELLSARQTASGATPLHLAAASGDVDCVQALLRAGCSVSSPANNGATPLHWAAGGGHTVVVRELLAAGAPAEARSSTWTSTVRGDGSGQTAAHWAAATGHSESLAALLSAEPHALLLRDERDLTPAAVAQRDGHTWLKDALEGLRDQQVVCVQVSYEMGAQLPVGSPASTPASEREAGDSQRPPPLTAVAEPRAEN